VNLGAVRGLRALRAVPALTPAGRAVLGGSAVVGAAGWALGHRELLTVALVGAVAVALAVPWGWATPAADAERSVAPARVTRGDPAEGHLRVRRNGGWQPALVIRDRVAGAPLDTPVPHRVDGTFEARYRLPTDRRGAIAVGPLSAVRSDPLGLVASTRRLAPVTTLWVHPRVHAVAPLGSGRRRDLEGPTEDRASGSITFHALREYVPGDDLRLVHWLSTARTGTLMVRQQVDPSQPHTTVVLDTRRRSYAGEAFEDAVDAAASLVVASTSRRFPVRLLTTGGLVAGGRRGQTQARPLLDELTVVAASGAEARSLPDVAGASSEPAGRCLVVVTGRPPEGELDAVRAQGPQVAALAVVRIDAAAGAGVVRAEGAVEVVAGDAEQFARLWAM
jgi:uncharacterized protein (DUF58 family)